eukprot:UN06550
MADEEENDHPVETKVSCWNYCCRMLGCCDAVSNSDGPPNLREGVLKKRIITDVPFIALCIIFSVICAVVIWEPCMANGNINRFKGASDYLKQTCGIDDGVKNLPFAAWPDVTEFDIKICVSDCSETQNSEFYGGGYSSDKIVYWCVPDKDSIDTAGWEAFESQFDDNKYMRYMADMYDYRYIPIYGVLFAFGLLGLYFVVVYWCLKILFRILYVALLAATILGGVSCMQDGMDDEASYYMGIAILCIGSTLWIILMCCWEKLMNVLDVMQEASHAIIIMPQTLFVPIFFLPFIIGVILWWYIVVLMMFSAGDYEQNTMPSSTYIDDCITTYYGSDAEKDYYNEIDYDVDIQNTFFVHLFWLLWGIKFLEYMQFLIVSGTVADWYLDQNLVDNPNENQEYKKEIVQEFFHL